MLPERGDASEMAQPLLVQGLCLLQVGSAQRWPRQGSSKTPHQLQHQPGERQLEIPVEGQRRQQLLLSHAGVWQWLWQLPAPRGRFCGWLSHSQAQLFPVPVSYQGDIPPMPRRLSPQNTHRRTLPASKRTPAAALPGVGCLSGRVRAHPSLAAA